MEEIAITISYSDSNGGYMYDIYKNAQAIEDNDDSIDGGLCTGSMLDAIDMAAGQAKQIIAKI